VKQKAFFGEGNRHWSECLKNAVSSLLLKGEDKFLNRLLNIHVLYLHCGRGSNCLHRRRLKRCLINWSLCDKPEKCWSTQSATSYLTHLNITVSLMPPPAPRQCQSQRRRHFCFCHLTLWRRSIMKIVWKLVVVAIRIHKQQSNTFPTTGVEQ
jgi:hypothetical protein